MPNNYTSYDFMFGGDPYGHRHYNGPVDEHDNPVKRTKSEYPYSYDGYVLWRNSDNTKKADTVYSDRLHQWDSNKTNRLWGKHCKGKNWTNVSSDSLRVFLSEWNNEPNLKIVFLMEYCNGSNGYPVWRVDYTV